MVLTAAQRRQFTRFPALDERLLAQHYSLSEADLKQAMNRRRDFNRLGYAVQLTVLQHLGRALTAREQLPPEVLEVLGEQLGVQAACYPRYAARANTRHEHFAELCARCKTLGSCRYPSLDGEAAAMFLKQTGPSHMTLTLLGLHRPGFPQFYL